VVENDDSCVVSQGLDDLVLAQELLHYLLQRLLLAQVLQTGLR
jgi:hypothetical protein